MNDNVENDPRLYAIPDIHGHAKGEHKAFADERPIPLSARMLFLWFYHACRRGWPRFLMVTDHMNYLTFEDPAAINLVRRALKLAQAGDLYGAAETASVEVGHAAVVSEGLRRGMRYSIGAEVDNDPRSRPDAQNIVDAMKPDGMIRSVHFLTIDHPTHGPNWNWPFDNPEFSDVYEVVGIAKTWELYMATLLDAVERLPGNILGHFYVPALFGHWPDDATLDAYEDRIIDACEARGMAIEVNTRFLYRDHSDEEKAKYLAAHRRLLVKCKAKNVGIAVGSDAHSPKDQSRGFGTVLALLDECAINELVFPIAGRLARVALRVERKTEPAAAPDTPADVADERKPIRRARTSEVPARAKDSSSRRDEPDGPDEPSGSDDAPAPKPKPRPKRSKNRAASSGDEPSDAKTAAGAASNIASEDAPFDEPMALDATRAPDLSGPAGDGEAASGGDDFALPNEAHRIVYAVAENVAGRGQIGDNRVDGGDSAAVAQPSADPRAGTLEPATLNSPDHGSHGSARAEHSGSADAADGLVAGAAAGERLTASLAKESFAREPATGDQTTRVSTPKKRTRFKAGSAKARSPEETRLDVAAGSPGDAVDDEAPLQDDAGYSSLEAATVEAATVAGLDAAAVVAILEDAVIPEDAAALDDAALEDVNLEEIAADAALEDIAADAALEEIAAFEEIVTLGDIAADAGRAEAAENEPIAGEPVDDEPIVVLTTTDIVIEAEFEPIVSTVVDIQEIREDETSDAGVILRVDLDGDESDEAIAVDATGAVVRLDIDEDGSDDGPAATETDVVTFEPEYVRPTVRNARVKTGAAKAKGTAGGAKAKTPPSKSKPAVKKSAKAAATATVRKAVAQKAAAKKTSAKKAAVKKTPVKKGPVKKAAAPVTAAKKAGVKKIGTKKSNPKKPAPKRR